MKKPDITEGEWQWMKFLNDDGTIEEITIDNGDEHNIHLIAEIFWSKNSEYKETHLAVLKEAKANAQAISAVPNLIKEGCKIVYAYENDMGVTDAEIEALKQALKKAGCKE